MIITNRISYLSDINYLHSIIPQIISIETHELKTNGCSASEFFKLTIKTTNNIQNLILKINDVKIDWLSLRSNDPGREGILLTSPFANSLWDLIENPYIAIALEKNKYALLMDDLSERIDLFNKMSIDDQDNVALMTLAKIHAQFWDNNELGNAAALMGLRGYLQINGPFNDHSNTSQPIGKKIFRGWDEAKKILSPKTYKWLTRTAKEEALTWDRCPNTLLHGDYRPMNLGYSAEKNKMVVIDWALAGFGPCTIDLYFYLASTSQFRCDKDKPVKLYKMCLEEELKRRFTQKEWELLSEIGIVCSCYMLLWDKALGYSKKRSDWDWWVNKLEEVVNKYEG